MAIDQDRAREEIHAILSDRAVLRKTIYYGELVETLTRKDPETYEGHLLPSTGWFHELLGDISKATLKEHSFALSALVISKDSDLPGDAFLEWGRYAEWPLFDQGDEAMIDEQHRLAFEHYRLDR